jgi:hypothetical protein
MGRPLNKRRFGTTNADNIRVRFHNGTASVNGAIVKQVGSKQFQCVDDAGVKTICTLTNKVDANIAAGDMSITIKTDAGTIGYVTKIAGRKITAKDASGAIVHVGKFNFVVNTTDAAAQMEEAGNTSTFTNSVDLP